MLNVFKYSDVKILIKIIRAGQDLLPQEDSHSNFPKNWNFVLTVGLVQIVCLMSTQWEHMVMEK